MRLLVSALIVSAFMLPAHAQTYPDRTIRIIVPFAAGGSTDIVARTTSQKLSERLRQSVVIDNRGGGGGNIGSDMVAKAPPDGYTLLIGTVGSLTINPALYKKMPYEPLKDLTPIGYIGSTPHVLVVHPSLPTRSVRELTALARSKPGELNYASGGTGGSTHLAAELFKSLTKVDMVHVPFKGGALGMVSLLGGHVQLMFQTMPPVLPHVKSGRLRALGYDGSRSLATSARVADDRRIGPAGLRSHAVVGFAGSFRTVFCNRRAPQLRTERDPATGRCKRALRDGRRRRCAQYAGVVRLTYEIGIGEMGEDRARLGRYS